MKDYDRVYAKINLDAVSFNMASIQKKLSPNTKIMAVVKSDGYGHGAVEIAKEIESFPSLFGFAVATYEEASFLRKHGIQKPLLILGYTFEKDYETLVKEQIQMCVYSYDMAKQLSKAAQKAKMDALIHVKIDTGMGRIGYQATEEAADEIAQIANLPHIVIEGLFTHFAKADEEDKTYSYAQMEKFQQMISFLKKRNVEIRSLHSSNSAGILRLPQANMDFVRAGILLYGLWPFDKKEEETISLKPVMELKSKIIHIKTLEAGSCISYGGAYRLNETKTIATIPVGYGDGYPRSLSNKGYVLIHGKKAPILGRVCMDQFMVDVTNIPDVTLLDTVTLLGKDGKTVLTMEELGALSGRFNYEFACGIGKRIPRIYYRSNRPVSTKDYFNE